MTAGSGSETAALAQAARQHWLGVLARARRDELERHVEALTLPAFTWLRRPEVGMVMLRGRAGGTGQPFNLGEATVTRCAVRAGNAVGTGHVLGRDARHAELVARLDAALQDAALQDAALKDSAQQAALIDAVIAPLKDMQRARREAASRAAATTKVEFFTLVRE